jgi:hypothetical protein
MKLNINQFDTHTNDWVMLNSLSKLLGTKEVLSHQTMWEALYWAALEAGLLHLPVTRESMHRVTVIYEKVNPVKNFVNASIKGVYKNPMFTVMDAWDKNTWMICYDDSFKSPNTLFIATHGTPLKRSITHPGFVVTATFDETDLDTDCIPVKQLISLKSFL